MEIIKILIVVLFPWIYYGVAKGAAVMTPVIYASNLSSSYFIANLVLLTFFYICAKGFANGLYFGKPNHEIIRLLFSFIGRFIVLILTSLVAIKLFNPIGIREMFISSVFAALLSFIIFAFANFRFYRLMREEKRVTVIRSLISYAIMVFIANFFSISLAVSTEIINTTGDFEKEFVEGRNEMGKYDLIKKSVWFFPQNEEPCEIFQDGIKLSDNASVKNCFYFKTDVEVNRIFCPLEVNISDLPLKDNMVGQEVLIRGKGSCVEEYHAILKKNGFILK